MDRPNPEAPLPRATHSRAAVGKNDHECTRIVPSVLHTALQQQDRGWIHFDVRSGFRRDVAGNPAARPHPALIGGIELPAPFARWYMAIQAETAFTEVQN